jgi:hypothetical protein
MKAVFQLFWRICLLRQSPAHVPTENWFVITVIAANLLTSVIVSFGVDPNVDAMQIITRVVVGQAAYASFLWLATFLRQHPARFPAALTALFGCDLLITALFGLLLPFFGVLIGTQALNLASTGFLLWSLAVAGFILAEALSVPLLMGILLALGMMVLSVSAGFAAIGG